MNRTATKYISWRWGRSARTFFFALSALIVWTSTAAHAEPVTLKRIASGVTANLGWRLPQRLPLTERRPATIKKEPANLVAPRYGVLTLGPKESPTRVTILLDAPDGKDARLYVDANGDGDLTNDPAPEWEKRAYKGRDGKEFTAYSGGMTIQVRYGEETASLHFGLFLYDPADAAHDLLRDTLLYHRDYACEGTMTLDGRSYKVMLLDEFATGDFRGQPDTPTSGVLLLIDVNGNGVFEPRGERFDATQPFNVRGTTYELRDLHASGTRFTVIKSARTVAEVPPPPDLRVGKKAVPFEGKATSGKTIKFPDDYKGKLVLLHFWATWCGVCRSQMPAVVNAYTTFHSRGLEIVGVSLDPEKADATLAAFTKEYNMRWPQIYDGKFLNAALGQLYFVTNTPTLYLVDGDTGEILATGDDLHPGRLDATLTKMLANRKH